MKRQRRLRRLVPDAKLIRRRAAAETLRGLAPDYHVSHTTLGRHFARPQVARQLRQAVKALAAEQRAAAARRRRLERDVRATAKRQAAAERERVRRAARGTVAGGRRAARSAHAASLDEHDAAVPLSRTDLYSHNDDRAARVVAGQRSRLPARALAGSFGHGWPRPLSARASRSLRNLSGRTPMTWHAAGSDQRRSRLRHLPPPLRCRTARAAAGRELDDHRLRGMPRVGDHEMHVGVVLEPHLHESGGDPVGRPLDAGPACAEAGRRRRARPAGRWRNLGLALRWL